MLKSLIDIPGFGQEILAYRLLVDGYGWTDGML